MAKAHCRVCCPAQQAPVIKVYVDPNEWVGQGLCSFPMICSLLKGSRWGLQGKIWYPGSDTSNSMGIQANRTGYHGKPGSKSQEAEELKVCFCPVCLGCYNKIPQVEWLINNRISFLTALETGSLRVGCQQGWVRALLRLQTSQCVLTGRNGLGVLLEPVL